MMPGLLSARSCAIVFSTLSAIPVFCQGNQPKGQVSFRTTLGSLKFVPHNDTDLVTGHLEMSFTGTVLVSGLDDKGRITPSGSVRMEYQDKDHRKVVFFGTGKLVVDGTCRSIQWFGRDMQGTFSGRGVLRLFGEFDRQGKTGDYWYGAFADAKAQRTPWGTYGITASVPEDRIIPAQGTVPVPRRGGG